MNAKQIKELYRDAARLRAAATNVARDKGFLHPETEKAYMRATLAFANADRELTKLVARLRRAHGGEGPDDEA